MIETIFRFPELMRKKEAEVREEMAWRTYHFSSIAPWPDIGCPHTFWKQTKEHLRAVIFFVFYSGVLFPEIRILQLF